MAKKNLTIRIDDNFREQLQLIADIEMRPLANQIIYFLVKEVEAYKEANHMEYNEEKGCFVSADF